MKYILLLRFQVEVFNLLFVKEINKKLMVHCQDCARKTSATLDGFKVLNQVRLLVQPFITLMEKYNDTGVPQESVLCLHYFNPILSQLSLMF